MSMNLAVEKFKHDEGYFEAGPYPVAKAVKVAAEAVKQFAPVQLDDSGKVKPIADADVDKVYGIAVTAAEAEKETVVYLTGEFFADALQLESEVTVDKLEAPMRKIGIFLKEIPKENP